MPVVNGFNVRLPYIEGRNISFRPIAWPRKEMVMHLPIQSAGVPRRGTAFQVAGYHGSTAVYARIGPADVNCNCSFECNDGTTGSESATGVNFAQCGQKACAKATTFCAAHHGLKTCRC